MTERSLRGKAQVSETTEQTAHKETELELAFKRLVVALEDKAVARGITPNEEGDTYPFVNVDREDGTEEDFLLLINPSHLDSSGRILSTSLDLVHLVEYEETHTPLPILYASWNVLTQWGNASEIRVKPNFIVPGAENSDFSRLIGNAASSIEEETACFIATKQSNGNTLNLYTPNASRRLN